MRKIMNSIRAGFGWLKNAKRTKSTSAAPSQLTGTTDRDGDRILSTFMSKYAEQHTDLHQPPSTAMLTTGTGTRLITEEPISRGQLVSRTIETVSERWPGTNDEFSRLLEAVNKASARCGLTWRMYMDSTDLTTLQREVTMLYWKNEFVLAERELDAALAALRKGAING